MLDDPSSRLGIVHRREKYPRHFTRSTMDDENGNSRPAHHALRRGSESIPERVTVPMATNDNEICIVLSSNAQHFLVRSTDANLFPDQAATDLRAYLTESHACARPAAFGVVLAPGGAAAQK